MYIFRYLVKYDLRTGFFFQPKQVRLPHPEIPVPHNFRFRFLTIISFLNIFFLNLSTLIIYHELFNWHGGGAL